MGDQKNLNSEEAINKIKYLAEEIKTGMFCTYKECEIQSRPMSALEIDDEGHLWFMTDQRSNKVAEIKSNPTVELFYTKGYDMFLSLHGKATILHDREKIEELWNPIIKVWMPGGVEDPNLCIIKFTFDHGYYWNNKHNKMVVLAKMAASLLTGKTMDDGIEGKLT
ncbi:pyridoxamine 5'-phosphate oxidase family protein [Flavobacterium soli]|uniref:pyridoxamine 5'-phosphate oxidase family protein n=1 Tax=Flavobacterium soli TaxID=344881 RepID=UPI0004010CD3|nr:pyridoxamine 5'-phosphate oxidase family protein [Flavobacterium soli]